jgi:STE24 endopeptidase
VVLLPLFYKYKPLDRPELKARLLALAEKCGARVVDVFELQLSAKSKAANAALAGLGRTRRILLGDTLLNRYTEDEIEAVLAHELGHHVHSHLWKNIGAQTGIVFLGFFLAGRFLGWGVSAYGFEDHADLAAFPLLAVTFVVLLPAVNSLSRQYEREADRFAAEVTGRPEALASALERLAEQNLADREPNPVAEFLFYSHPSIGRRVRALGKDES